MKEPGYPPPEKKKDTGLEGDHTPQEWRAALRELVETRQRLTGEGRGEDLLETISRERLGKEKKPSLTERMGNLKERVKELDETQALKAEKFVHELGERYNNLSLWKKVLIGGGLTVGLAGFTAVSTPIASLFGGAIALQRAYGMASMFVKFEKHLQETHAKTATGFFANREWYRKLAERPEQDRKNMAAVMALGYTFGMSAAISKTAQELSDSPLGMQVHEWLRHRWPFGEAAIVPATGAGASKAVPATISNGVIQVIIGFFFLDSITFSIYGANSANTRCCTITGARILASLAILISF
mgnify:CR=1 FL=1